MANNPLCETGLRLLIVVVLYGAIVHRAPAQIRSDSGEVILRGVVVDLHDKPVKDAEVRIRTTSGTGGMRKAPRRGRWVKG